MRFRVGGCKLWWLVICLWLTIQPIRVLAQAPGKMPPPTVVVATVTQGELESSLYLIGTTYPLVSSTISAQVAGNIERFMVAEGTFVEEAEVICQLDKTLKLIEVKRTEAELGQARKELAKKQAEMVQAQYQVESRKAIKDKLELNKGRMEDLYSKGMVTQEQKDNARLDYEQAEALFGEAKAFLNVKSQDIMVAEATIDIQQAELEQAEDNLSQTNITAPFQGVVVKKYKEVGEWVKAGEAVAEIINITKVLVHTSVPEKDIGALKQGQPAEIRFDAYADQLHTGTVKEIIPQADVQSRSFPVKIEVDNKKHKLYAGMFARLKLITGKQRMALLVPKDAVLKVDDTKYLFVIKDSIAHQVKVNTGQEKGELIEVAGELKIGNKVVVTNNEVLRDKLKVIIAPSK